MCSIFNFICIFQILVLATFSEATVAPFQTPKYFSYPTASYQSYATCDPIIPPLCAYNGTVLCLEDENYPIYDIQTLIQKDPLFLKKYPSTANSLTAESLYNQEIAYDYSYYTGFSKGSTPFDITHWQGPEGYICPSQTVNIKPLRAKNVEGHWRIIVNDYYPHHYYTQSIKIETCLYPESACRTLAPCYNSHCSQKFVYHRLLSYDVCDPYKGLFIDIFRFPSSCSCHVDY